MNIIHQLRAIKDCNQQHVSLSVFNVRNETPWNLERILRATPSSIISVKQGILWDFNGGVWYIVYKLWHCHVFNIMLFSVLSHKYCLNFKKMIKQLLDTSNNCFYFTEILNLVL